MSRARFEAQLRRGRSIARLSRRPRRRVRRARDPEALGRRRHATTAASAAIDRPSPSQVAQPCRASAAPARPPAPTPTGEAVIEHVPRSRLVADARRSRRGATRRSASGGRSIRRPPAGRSTRRSRSCRRSASSIPAIGYCAPTSGPQQPLGPREHPRLAASMAAPSSRSSCGRSRRDRVISPYGALFGPPAELGSTDSWPNGLVVFRYDERVADAGAERWFAIEVSGTSEDGAGAGSAPPSSPRAGCRACRGRGAGSPTLSACPHRTARRSARDRRRHRAPAVLVTACVARRRAPRIRPPAPTPRRRPRRVRARRGGLATPAIAGLSWVPATGASRGPRTPSPAPRPRPTVPTGPGTAGHPGHFPGRRSSTTSPRPATGSSRSATSACSGAWTALAWTSDDGDRWDLATIDETPGSFAVSLAVGPGADGRIVAGGRSGGRRSTWDSTDGRAWTRRTIPTLSDGLEWERIVTVLATDDGFIAGGSAGPELGDRRARFWRSADGIDLAARPRRSGLRRGRGRLDRRAAAAGSSRSGGSGPASAEPGRSPGSPPTARTWQRIDSPALAVGARRGRHRRARRLARRRRIRPRRARGPRLAVGRRNAVGPRAGRGLEAVQRGQDPDDGRRRRSRAAASSPSATTSASSTGRRPAGRRPTGSPGGGRRATRRSSRARCSRSRSARRTRRGRQLRRARQLHPDGLAQPARRAG